jgi:hypothetical protein
VEALRGQQQQQQENMKSPPVPTQRHEIQGQVSRVSWMSAQCRPAVNGATFSFACAMAQHAHLLLFGVQPYLPSRAALIVNFIRMQPHFESCTRLWYSFSERPPSGCTVFTDTRAFAASCCCVQGTGSRERSPSMESVAAADVMLSLCQLKRL